MNDNEEMIASHLNSLSFRLLSSGYRWGFEESVGLGHSLKQVTCKLLKKLQVMLSRCPRDQSQIILTTHVRLYM